MSVNSFIPQLWVASLMEKLRKELIFGQAGVINRDYQGVIANQGDTVRVNMLGNITVSNHTRGAALGTPETLDTTDTALTITESKKIHYVVDDIDQVQAAGNLRESAMEEATYGLADTADQFIATTMADGVSADNFVGSSASPKTDLGTSGKAYEYLVQLKTALDEANVPSAGRFAALPPWYEERLLLDQTYLQGTGSAQSETRMANGVIGRLAGFTLLGSNNVVNDGTTYEIVAGVASATTFAQQISSMEAYRSQSYFGDEVRGLHLYGAKVIRPRRLAKLYANKPS